METLAAQVQQITASRWNLPISTRVTPENTQKTPLPNAAFKLEVVKHTQAKRGFVLLPRRWVVERSFAWAARFRRLARDYERLRKPRRLPLTSLCLPHA